METKKVETVDATKEIMHSTEKVKKEQKVSYSYALKAMAEHAKKLNAGLYWNDEEYTQYLKLHKKAVMKYMGQDLGMDLTDM